MKVLVVRHGETAYNAEDRISGNADIPLNHNGIAQAEALTEQIPNDTDVIYSSDLLRCRQTTDILNRRHVPVVFDVRLRERGAGSLEGKLWKEVDPGGEMKKMNRALRYDFKAYGGESVDEVRARVTECLGEIKQREKGRKVLIVTSAGVIRLLHHELHGDIRDTVHNMSVEEFELN